VLHASLQGADKIGVEISEDGMVNASSTLHLKEGEVSLLRDALGQCDGSFEQLFKRYGKGAAAGPTEESAADTQIV
jgi:hypothetical protein